MTDLEQRILDIIQDGFPLVERPYAAIAEMLAGSHSELYETKNFSSQVELCPLGSSEEPSLGEQQIFEVVESLRSSGVIRRIGGVYDSKKLGYTSRLCCGIIPQNAENGGESPIDQFAAVVNEIPAITHNYIRSHQYNVWFTVIGKSEEEIRNVVCNLERQTALRDSHILNAKKLFKINTVMTRLSRSRVDDGKSKLSESSSAGHSNLTDGDWARIHLLSGDLSHSLTPFSSEIIDGIQSDLASRRMRRFGAVLRHQQAGFAENAMVCFKIQGSESFSAASISVDRAGALLAEESFVSHCYERDAFGPFPYNVYAMVHGNSPDDLNTKIRILVKKLDNPEYTVLRSERELKKTSFRF